MVTVEGSFSITHIVKKTVWEIWIVILVECVRGKFTLELQALITAPMSTELLKMGKSPMQLQLHLM